jgi:hypothetical protein
MDLEERTLDDNFAQRCSVCGVELTKLEIDAAREAGGAFLCTVHATEELPVPVDPDTTGDDAD